MPVFLWCFIRRFLQLILFYIFHLFNIIFISQILFIVLFKIIIIFFHFILIYILILIFFCEVNHAILGYQKIRFFIFRLFIAYQLFFEAIIQIILIVIVSFTIRMNSDWFLFAWVEWNLIIILNLKNWFWCAELWLLLRISILFCIKTYICHGWAQCRQ